MNRENVLVGVALAVAAIVGALVSRHVRDGGSFIWTYAAGMIGISVWAWQSRSSAMSLAMASLYFDVVYNVAWFMTLVAMGERMKPVHGVGAALLLGGLALLSL